MKLVVFTSNAHRHKYLANMLAAVVRDCIAVAETKPCDDAGQKPDTSLFVRNFAGSFADEARHFDGHEMLRAKFLPLMHGEVNSGSALKTIDEFKPDAAVVFGASIIRKLLLSSIPAGKFINLHLGLSPYYRGSGTNFWPFVNRELQYVGAMLLHIDAGIDTGDIVAHVRPEFTPDDTVHSVGCKTIKPVVAAIVDCLYVVGQGRALARVQ